MTLLRSFAPVPLRPCLVMSMLLADGLLEVDAHGLSEVENADDSVGEL